MLSMYGSGSEPFERQNLRGTDGVTEKGGPKRQEISDVDVWHFGSKGGGLAHGLQGTGYPVELDLEAVPGAA
jgi:hypothetical protein